MLQNKLLYFFILLLLFFAVSLYSTISAGNSDSIPDSQLGQKTEQEKLVYKRTEILLAQIDVGQGRIKHAYSRLLALYGAFPESPDVLTALLNLESFMSIHLKALDRIENVAEIMPDNMTIAAIAAYIDDQRRSYVKVEERFRFLNNNREAISTLEGRLRLTPNIEIGIRTVLNYIVAKDIQRGAGAAEDLTTWRREHELYGSYEFFGGSKIRLSLFTNENRFGGGLNLQVPIMLGGAAFFADINRPVWDFTEGVLDYATVTRAGMQQFFTIRLDNRPMVRAAYNLYSIKDMRDVSESFTLFCIWRIPLRFTRRLLFFEYGLGAEYLIHLKTTRDHEKQSYYPLINREVHYATLGLRKDISTRFIAQSFFEIYLGWAYDRFGENGPQTGAVYVRQLTKDLECKLFGGYGAVTGEGATLTTGFTGNAGIHLLWKL